MKKIILLLLLFVSALMAETTKVALPTFELDVQYSKNAKEQLLERNEIITVVITVSKSPKSKMAHFLKRNNMVLLKKEIVVNESTLLTINNMMLDKKYEKELDNLFILINAYSSPAPFESCDSNYHDEFFIEESVKNLKNKKHLFPIQVEDDFRMKK
jgi:dihydroxyacetone kinase-like predicted kinase